MVHSIQIRFNFFLFRMFFTFTAILAVIHFLYMTSSSYIQYGETVLLRNDERMNRSFLLNIQEIKFVIVPSFWKSRTTLLVFETWSWIASILAFVKRLEITQGQQLRKRRSHEQTCLLYRCNFTSVIGVILYFYCVQYVYRL